MEEGWEYALTHGSTYHAIERTVDMARRRRWLRKVVAVDPTKPAIFYFRKDKKQRKKDVCIIIVPIVIQKV